MQGPPLPPGGDVLPVSRFTSRGISPFCLGRFCLLSPEGDKNLLFFPENETKSPGKIRIFWTEKAGLASPAPFFRQEGPAPAPDRVPAAGYHLRGKQKTTANDCASPRWSLAVALKAFALHDIHDVLGFADPAEGHDLVSLGIRQDLHHPPVTAAAGTFQPTVPYCQHLTTFPMGLQCFRRPFP